MNATHVHKLGGTTVGEHQRLAVVAAHLAERAREERVVVVVSALAGVTDALVGAAHAAAGGRLDPRLLPALAARHHALLAAVAPRARTTLGPRLEWALARLETWLLEAAGRRALPPRLEAEIVAHGERLAAPLVAALLRAHGLDAEAVDSTRVLLADGDPREGEWRAAPSRLRARRALARGAAVPVVTGFFAGDRDGRTVLLGRGGSDLAATALASVLAADCTLWTDTDGVMSADPGIVAGARGLVRLDHATATELARWGARVLHPRALEPFAGSARVLRVADSRHPERPGTLLVQGTTADEPVSVTSSPALRVLVAAAAPDPRVLGEWFAAARVPVLALTAACRGVQVVLPESACTAALAVLTARGVTAEEGGALATGCVALVAPCLPADAVPRARAALIALGEAGAPLRTSARSVAVTCAPEACDRIVEAWHAAFVRERPRVAVVVAGASGRVGRAFLRQFAAQRPQWEARAGVELHLVGALRRGVGLWADRGLDPATAPDALACAPPLPESAWVARLSALGGERVVLDCTASESLPGWYGRLLADGVHLVLANKHAGAGPLARWRGLESRAVGRSCALRDGTTVGAALPVLESVRALVARGDRVRALDAVLSGSLAFVLARVHEGAPFSAAVAEAVTLGLAEPDPAEDLGGADVARKLVIVLRAAGEGIERGQVRLAPLADAGDLADPVRRARLDRRWRRRVAAARARGERWVYTARWDGSTARVGAERRPLADPLARLRAGENAVVVWSRHYAQVPLTVAGPGAGPEVTAAGLVTDLLAALRPAAAVRDPVPPGVTAESA